jgi:hypothetical protein
MNTLSFHRLLAVAALIACCLSSCVTQLHLLDLAEDVGRKHGKAEPESEWNCLNEWKRVEDNPPSYIPAAYSSTAPRTEKEGVWEIDKRDGKRLFVPHNMPPPLSTGVLIGEAKKITANIQRSYTTTGPGILTMP